MIEPDEKFMELAIEQAKKAAKNGDYAIGAVVVKGDEIVSVGFGKVKTKKDPILHAEIVAISKAAKKLKKRHLENCILYTTHEPCPMCAAAIVWAKISGTVYGARNEDMEEYSKNKGDHKFTWRTIAVPSKIIFENGEPKVHVIGDFMREECKKLFSLSK